MKERNLKELAKELANLIGESTPETAVKAAVVNFGIELHPTGENDGRCFYHMENVVDFCRCKKFSCYTAIDSTTGKVICRII